MFGKLCQTCLVTHMQDTCCGTPPQRSMAVQVGHLGSHAYVARKNVLGNGHVSDSKHSTQPCVCQVTLQSDDVLGLKRRERCTLKDLCDEDKQKVAKLIRQVSCYSPGRVSKSVASRISVCHAFASWLTLLAVGWSAGC